MMHNDHLKKKAQKTLHKHYKEDNRENINNAAYESTREHVYAVEAQREKGG